MADEAVTTSRTLVDQAQALMGDVYHFRMEEEESSEEILQSAALEPENLESDGKAVFQSDKPKRDSWSAEKPDFE